MSHVAATPDTAVEDRLNTLLALQRAAFAANPYPSLKQRLAWLDRLEQALLSRKDAIVAAASADFGGRSRYETLVADIMLVALNIRYLRKHLAGWMKVERRSSGLLFAPSRSRVVYQPKGVVGVIAPWNYPVQLGLLPVATALAAGNRVLLKPSELTPRTSEVLEELFDAFDDDLVAVVQGDAATGAAFSRLPFDHLLFTGSTRVGREVLRAAAEHLVPVTLELGGKSPAIVHPGYDLQRAAAKIAHGKLFNAGQTCIAPDYVLVPSARRDDFVHAFRAQVGTMFPKLVDNDDYTAIINGRQRARLGGLLDDARSKGATLVTINPAGETFDAAATKMPPVLVLDATDDMAVMQDEIFGPILPVVVYDTPEDAVAYVNARPRPLALYVFDDDAARVDRVIRSTHAGGVAVNATLLHCAVEDLPFGGIGPSGMGAYHGPEGFKALSHAKAVFHQSRIDTTGLLNPPYGPMVDRLLSWLG